jgi:hypothetical protein
VTAGGGGRPLGSDFIVGKENGMAAHAELVSDLKALRKGRGLYVNNVDERVGRGLRALCGVTEDDGPGIIRHRVARQLEHLAGGLPDDLRIAVMAAFGMIPDARRPLYQDRVCWIAERIGRDPRTARRRIDDGIHQLAQLACTPRRMRGPAGPRVGEPVTGWHTSALRMSLTLDRFAPEVLEHHRIVSARPDLTEVEVVSHHDARCAPVGVVYGGTLVDRGTESRPSYALTLPTPMDVGESHDFALRSRMTTRHAIPRELVYQPRRRCDFFELRVRFDPNFPPRLITRVGDPLDGPSEPAQIDRAGEIRLVFRDLRRGTTYGARWDF